MMTSLYKMLKSARFSSTDYLSATSIGLVVILTTFVAEGLRFESWGALLLYSLVL
jgi:hypothetical protein